MTELDATYVRQSLRKLSANGAKIFGAAHHKFLLNPPLAEFQVLAFEQKHQIHLPADYRHFVTTIGDGGAGPFYGILPLGKMDGLGDKLQSWTEGDGFIGALSKPFPLSAPWNDLTGAPNEELIGSNESEYERKLVFFEKRYWNPSNVNGAIPICHQGCALRNWLVVTGEQSGRIWFDGRSDRTGIKPTQLADGSPASFSMWYAEWLRDALRHLRRD